MPQNLGNMRPSYLDARDEPWIESLLTEYRRFIGRPDREWRQRLREPFQFYCPRVKLRHIVKALDPCLKGQRNTWSGLKTLRLALFQQSDSVSWPDNADEIDSALWERRKGIFNTLTTVEFGQVEDWPTANSDLFADLPTERPLPELPDELSIQSLILLANTSLAQGLIQRSRKVDLRLRGRARPVVRQARLRGLICVVSPILGDPEFETLVSISGPLAIFRNVRLYGRLLTEILPFASQCERFLMTVEVPRADDVQNWIIKSGDPLKPAMCQTFDSRIERLFVRDFLKLTKDYDLVREPLPIAAGRQFIFPDFAIKHRTDCSRNFLLEIVGYWTPEYIQKKISDLSAAKVDNIIICIDEKFGVDMGWPPGAHVILFKRRIDAAQVLNLLSRFSVTSPAM